MFRQPGRAPHRLTAVAALLLGLAFGVAGAQSPAGERSNRAGENEEPRYSPALIPLLEEAQRASREEAEAAARRAVAYYLDALRQRDYKEAHRWMPTELRRGGEQRYDLARNRIVWEALSLKRFVIEEVRLSGERRARVLVRWQASFDEAGYAEELARWQRERSLALGLEPSDVDRRMPAVRSMAARAAERLAEIVTQERVRLRLRPTNPDARVHPLTHEAWRIEDTFLAALD